MKSCLAAAIILFTAHIALAQSLSPDARTLPVEVVSNNQNGQKGPSFSADGSKMLLPDGNGAALWEMKSQRLIRRFAGLKSINVAAALSPNGGLVAASAGYVLNVWNAETGAVEATFDTPIKNVSAISFSQDGSNVYFGGSADLTGRTPTFVVRNIRTGEQKVVIGKKDLRSLDVSKVSGLVATGDSVGSIYLYDLNGRQVKQIGPHTSNSYYSPLESIAFSPDGKMLLSGGSDGLAKLWDVTTGRLLAILPGHKSISTIHQVQTISWSSDSRRVATTDMTTLRVWDMPSGKLLKSKQYAGISAVNSGIEYISGATFTPDDHFLMLSMNTYRKADANSLEIVSSFGSGIINEIVRHSGGAPNDVQIAGSNPRSLFSLNTISGQVEVLYASQDRNSYWDKTTTSADRSRVAGVDGYGKDTITILDLKPQPVLRVLRNDLQNSEYIDFFPDGRQLAVSGKTTISILDSTSGKLVKELYGNKYGPSALSVASDGKTVVTGWTGQTEIRVFDVSSWRSSPPIGFQILMNSGYAMAPDGRSFVVYGTKFNTYAAEQYSNSGTKPVRQFVLPVPDSMISAGEFSPDGKLLALGGFDSLIRIWEVNSARVVSTLKGHAGPLNGLLFAAGGKRLVSAGNDSVKIWDVTSGELLASYMIASDTEWVGITPEGFFDGPVSKTSLLSVVQGFEILSLDQVYNQLYRPDLVREKLAGDPKGLVREAAAKLDLNKVIASGAAPRVTIVTKPDNVTDDEATIEATITEQNGGGIGRIEWRVNGVTLGVESRGLERLPNSSPASSDASRPPVVVKRTLALEPGENKIEIVAYNGRDLIASEAAQIVLKWDGEKSVVPPKLHVLAVGVNDYYDSRLRLSYAVPDAKALGEALQKAGAAMYQSVEVTSVLDDAVTVDNLDRVFAEVSRKVHPRDVFVFFLAGHGKTVDGRYHFLPQNFRYENETSIVTRGIGQERFQSWFSTIPARKSILLYDTCESGSLTGDRVAQRGVERVAALEKMTRAMGRTVLSASSDDAPALEGYRGHGVFTYALLDGFQDADTNGNGLIEVTELAAYIDQQVPDLSYKAFKMRQIPQMKIVGNGFPLVSKTTVLDTGERATMSAPTKPTHVVISQAPIEVHAAAERHSNVKQTLSFGTTVVAVRGEAGWYLVSKEGVDLGYVEEAGLARAQ